MPAGRVIASVFFSPVAKTDFQMKTDTELRADVTEALIWDPAVTAGDINIACRNGVVTLSGTVPHFAEKRAAERASQRVEGVKAIAEEMEVHSGANDNRKDSEIADAVVSSLRWHVWVPDQVRAKVEDGWVELTGDVRWDYERSSAEDAVRFITGVKGVANKIVLVPAVGPAGVKAAIETALRRNAGIDAGRVDVTTAGGKVTLSGSIRSWGERQEAGSAARGTPGVTDVENNLLVSP
jgi:osmotically-inducible protein OsmY